MRKQTHAKRSVAAPGCVGERVNRTGRDPPAVSNPGQLCSLSTWVSRLAVRACTTLTVMIIRSKRPGLRSPIHPDVPRPALDRTPPSLYNKHIPISSTRTHTSHRLSRHITATQSSLTALVTTTHPCPALLADPASLCSHEADPLSAHRVCCGTFFAAESVSLDP